MEEGGVGGEEEEMTNSKIKQPHSKGWGTTFSPKGNCPWAP